MVTVYDPAFLVQFRSGVCEYTPSLIAIDGEHYSRKESCPIGLLIIHSDSQHVLYKALVVLSIVRNGPSVRYNHQ